MLLSAAAAQVRTLLPPKLDYSASTMLHEQLHVTALSE